MSIIDTLQARATRYVVCPSGLVYQIRRIKSSDTQGRFLSIIGLGAAAAAFEAAALGGDPAALAHAMTERARAFASEAAADPKKLDDLAGYRDAICCAAIVGVGEVSTPPAVASSRRGLAEVGPLTQAVGPVRFVADEPDEDIDAARLWIAKLLDEDRQAVSAAVQDLVSPKEELPALRPASAVA